MRKRSAFTVIELLIAIVVLTTAGILGYSNIKDLRQINADRQMKMTVNSLHYQLQAFYQTNKFYPQELTTKSLPGTAPDLLVDPSGMDINKPTASVTYNPKDCKASKCTGYSLKAVLYKEANFIKTNSDPAN